jgi:hypothetical protein
MTKIATENGRSTENRVTPSKTVNGPSEEEESNIRDGSISEKERPTRMASRATEYERSTEIRITPSKTVKIPPKGKGQKQEMEASPRNKGPPGRRGVALTN